MALVTSAAASLKNTWGFSPQSIPGCTLWLDAADTSSLTISPFAWTDKSGQGNTPTATGTLYGGTPVLPSSTGTINGIRAVRFSSSLNNEMLTTMNYNSTAITKYAVSFFLVVQLTSATQGRLFGGTTSSFQSYTISPYNPPCGIGIYTYGSPAEISSVANVSPSVPFILGFTVISGLVTGFLNGTAFAATSTVTSSSFTTMQWGGLGGNTPIDGNIGEIVVFNSGLSATQRQQVEGYLAAKWGLQANLPATHPYSATNIIPFNRPFYPTDISGCALWLDAADASTVTGTASVTAWADKSGTGNNMTLTSAGISYASNTITVAGGAIMTSSLSATITANQSFVFIVCQPTYVNGFGYVFTCSNINSDYTVRFGSTTTLYDYDPNSDFGYSGGYYVNGTLLTGSTITIPAQTNIIGGASTLSGSSVFQLSHVGGRYFYGTIQEVIFYTGPITAPQRQQVEQYLTWKWGLSTGNLPTGHPGKLLPAFSTNFTPKAITGLRWWVDGADTSTMTFSSGSNITQWRDKSGLGCNATGFNSPQKIPRGGVSFNATSSNYFTMTVPYSQTNTMFMVASPVPAIDANMYYTNTNPGNSGANFIGGYSSSYVDYYHSSITSFVSGVPTNQFIVSLVKPSGGTVVGKYNGVQSISIADVTTDGSVSSWAWLGGASNNAGLLTANIYEFIIFSVALTSNQVQQVEGYLAWKWGLQSSLPSTHAYAKFSP